jgi:hypothetical protein
MNLETVSYIDGKFVNVRNDGFLELNTLQSCLLDGKKDKDFNRWTLGKDVKAFILAESKSLNLLGNDSGSQGIFRGKTWDPNSKAKGVLEYYSNDGNNQSIIFIHKKLAIYYTFSKNPVFASWIIDIADRYVRGDLTLIKEVVQQHDKVNEVKTTVIELRPQLTQQEEEESKALKKRKEREDSDWEIGYEERKLALVEKRQHIERSQHDFKIGLFNELINNGSNPVVKENAKISKENLISLVCQHNVLLITSGQPSSTNNQVVQLLDTSLQEFSVSIEAQAILKRNDVLHYWNDHPTKKTVSKPEIAIGRLLHQKFIEKYGHSNENTRDQKSSNNTVYPAKVYQRKDIDLLVATLRDYYEDVDLV